MTTDTTTSAACVGCGKDTDDGYGRVNRRPLLANDGTTRYMCGSCYSAMPIERLRDYHWLPAHPSNQPPNQPPRTTAPTRRRRVDVHVQGACVLCGIAADPEWPDIHFTLGGVAILGPRCAPCDGGISGCDYDAALYLADVHGRQDLTEHDFYAGIVAWHAREGLRPPPPAQERWAF